MPAAVLLRQLAHDRDGLRERNRQSSEDKRGASIHLSTPIYSYGGKACSNGDSAMVRRPRRLGAEIELRAQESKPLVLPLPRPELLFICEPSSVDDLRTRSLTQDLAREEVPGLGPRGLGSEPRTGSAAAGASGPTARAPR